VNVGQKQESGTMERPTWDEYFSQFAFLAAARSHDSETKVGCVLVHENRIISVGYNGFCSGVVESSLPVTRPQKYPYMVHAEENAISNMTIKPNGEITAYVTHMPCSGCSKLLWQNNIRTWKIPEGQRVKSHSEEDRIIYDHLIENGLIIDRITPIKSYLNKLIECEKKEEQGLLF
jgi:deoxycytidylate deaminase